MLGYLSLIITAIGAAIGIVGETKKFEKKGIHKLTRWGWAALAIVTVGSSISLYETKTRNDELARQTESRNKIIEIARGEIKANIEGLKHILDEINTRANSPSESLITEITKYSYTELSSDKNIAALKRYNLLSNQETADWVYDPRSFSEILSAEILKRINELNEITQKYNLYLDDKTIKLVSEITNDDFLRCLTSSQVSSFLEVGRRGGLKEVRFFSMCNERNYKALIEKMKTTYENI